MCVGWICLFFLISWVEFLEAYFDTQADLSYSHKCSLTAVDVLSELRIAWFFPQFRGQCLRLEFQFAFVRDDFDAGG